MAGRDTPRGPGTGGEDPEVPPPSGEDILSRMPVDVISMLILPHAGAPDNQDRALILMGSLNRRMWDVVVEFLSRAPDSYLANLSHRGIQMLQSKYKGGVQKRLQKYKDSFPDIHRRLFSPRSPNLNEEVLRSMMGDAAALQRNLQHRYYRETVSEIILDGTDGSPENYPVLLLRLCRMVGIPLVRLLEKAVSSGSIEKVRFAVEEMREPVTDRVIIIAWCLFTAPAFPIMFDYLVRHMTGAPSRVRDAIRGYAEWRRDPGLADPDQLQHMQGMLNEIIDQVWHEQSDFSNDIHRYHLIRSWTKDLLMQAIERRQLNVAQFALDMGNTITMNHIQYVWNTQSSSSSTAYRYFIEAPEMFRFVVANIPDNTFYAYIRNLLRQFVAALADPERGDEARTLRARIEDIINIL